MVTAVYRIIKYGFQNFWRNRLVSIATILVLLLSVIVFLGLLIFAAVGRQAVSAIQDKIDISVYFKSNAPEDNILKLKNVLEKLTEVKAVEYISKDEALKIFAERHKADEVISQALSELNENPLTASLNIKAKDPRKYADIAAYLEAESFKSVIDKVSYGQNQVVIDRLAKIISVGKQAGILLTIVLVVIAVIVVFNTILLAIYSGREEISIMRLVGASNAFIRGPYIFVGILYGFLAAFTALVLLSPFIYLASPYVEIFIPGMKLWSYFLDNFLRLFGEGLLFSVGIGVVSSLTVIRRYLRD